MKIIQNKDTIIIKNYKDKDFTITSKDGDVEIDIEGDVNIDLEDAPTPGWTPSYVDEDDCCDDEDCCDDDWDNDCWNDEDCDVDDNTKDILDSPFNRIFNSDQPIDHDAIFTVADINMSEFGFEKHLYDSDNYKLAKVITRSSSNEPMFKNLEVLASLNHSFGSRTIIIVENDIVVEVLSRALKVLLPKLFVRGQTDSTHIFRTKPDVLVTTTECVSKWNPYYHLKYDAVIQCDFDIDPEVERGIIVRLKESSDKMNYIIIRPEFGYPTKVTDHVDSRIEALGLSREPIKTKLPFTVHLN